MVAKQELRTIKQRIEVFRSVREIPFSKSGMTNRDKVMLLKRKLSALGLDCRRRVVLFYWNDVNLPEYVLYHSNNNLCAHEYLEANIDNEWIKIDPLWDSNLEEYFTITDWSGTWSTKICIPYVYELTVEECEKYLSGNSIDKYNIKSTCFEFDSHLDEYLNSIRF